MEEDTFARAQLALFLKMPMDNDLIFQCPIGEGQKIIQRMRVKLSKLKKKARKLGRTPREFKMIVLEIKPTEGMEKVVLKKTANSITDFQNALREVNDFEGLTF